MKYIWILIAVIIVVRIDMILRFFDKTVAKYQSKTEPVKINEVESTLEVRPSADGPLTSASPKKIFLSMLDAFHNNPDEDVRKMALDELKKNPHLFNDKLDKKLEEEIYRWRNSLQGKNSRVLSFLLELMELLKGENQEMMKSFFSLYIEIDLADFLRIYSKTKDTNCLIATYQGDSLSPEEKTNELVERLNALNVFIAEENPEPLKAYAMTCQMVLKLHLDETQLKNATSPPVSAPVAPTTPGVTP
jgi:hypothetical protein